MAKTRLDILLFNLGMASSREKARALILAGQVQINGQMIDKAGTKVDEDAAIEVLSSQLPYVSRGGLKLEGAIKSFALDFQGKTVLDVGASTGGYTDCALQNGAAKVYALDVGYGQLDWSLRTDPRVVVIERTNIRYFTPEQLGELVDIITMDVAFISTSKIFPVLKTLLKIDGEIVSLIKPQFEAGRDKVGKKGVVKDPAIHRQVLLSCIAFAKSEGLNCVGVAYSPITGPRGNIEYFIHLKKQVEPISDGPEVVAAVVEQAHRQLKEQGGRG